MGNEVTFLIIKSDAIESGLVGEIIGRFEKVELKILRIEDRIKNGIWFQEHYAEVKKVLYPGYFYNMQQFMTQKTIGIVLRGENAIRRVRKMVGARNCFQADLGTIRGDLGHRADYHNLVHAADSVEAVKREIGLYFDYTTDREEN